MTVELLDHMGSDLSVVNAARVSFAKASDWEYAVEFPIDDMGVEVKRLSDRDARLINFLAAHGHWTPFGHPQAQFRIKMPIFVARQWFKHQVGFVRNEVSRRYVDYEPEYNVPLLRQRAENKKQGSGELFDHHAQNMMRGIAGMVMRDSLIAYGALIRQGVAPEQARMVLPQGVMTEFVETGSLYAYARLYGLRSQSDAQAETREYAELIGDEMKKLFPVSWKALTEMNEQRAATNGG